MKTKILTVLSIILLISTYTVSTFATTQEELEKQKNELKAQQNNAQNALTTIKTEKEETATALDTINNELITLNNEISALQSQINELNASIEAKEKEIKEKENEIDEKQKLLEKRLIAMYKTGGTSYLDVLLGSSSYIDMVSSYSVVEQIANADTKLIDQITNEKQELVNSKAELENKKSEVNKAKADKDSKNAQLNAKKTEKQNKVNSLTEDEKAKQKEVDEYNAAMTRVNNQLAAIAEQAKNQINSSGLKFDGSFIWPCNNKTVTSKMKFRWGRWHKGIDIAASYESVYASASGYAYNAYDASGYGNYIMIFHGGNYVTLYGHLSKSKISNGQYVKQGEVIATSGNTGGSTGPHLHFEIRQASSVAQFFSKSPLNPLDYLPGGYTIASGA